MEIAKRGGHVHMVCRNPTSAQEAKKEIEEEAGQSTPEVTVHILDLSKTGDVVAFTDKFVSENASLDCLVNNAGCMVNEREVVAESGLEKNFATNTLGTYLITEGLMPLLNKSADGRVIVVSSGGMLTQKLDLEDLQSEEMSPFTGTTVYAKNKRQQVVMTRKWADKYSNVFFASMHPGKEHTLWGILGIGT